MTTGNNINKKESEYKNKLENRLLEILQDFQAFDKEVVGLIPTIHIEEMGKHINGAKKLLESIRNQLPLMDMILKEKVKQKFIKK